MIGETVREFEIQSELGAGGYGAVYRAHDTSVNRDVAIKVILPKYANDPDFQQRFEHEAQLVAQLESRQIVPLYSYWQDERGAFLVMRYIRGGSLRRIMAKQDALSLSQTVRIVADIAEALAVAHENNVIHRDLKPENVLIDERGNAYLTDFGIAKRTTDADNITDADVIVGTWAYLSPEQIQSAVVSPQTDIYAFGIMLYEMLVGKHPFHGAPAPAILMKHLQELLPSICDERPDLPAQLDSIIQKATAKDPQDRYASTLDLVADLKMVANVSNTKATLQVKQVRKKTSGTPEERNRQAMLENVRSFWIEGVLENSLHDAAMIELGLKAESGKVDNPWDTLLRTPGGDESITDANVLDVFDRMNGKLLILGDPGSGKTTTLLMLARELLHRAESDDHHPMPVVFNLSSWSEKRLPLTEWLVEELNSKYQVPRKVGEKWITDEELLLLLDGLDEVATDARDACVTAINDYREQHGFVDVVVCSRIKDYEALHDQLRLKGAIVIQPLDDKQIVTYLDSLGNDVSVVRELINTDAQLRELAQSPLMLSIMILAYRGKTASDIPDFDNIEAQRQYLFETYVERMFDRRVGDKIYSKSETLHYLKWLAKKMQEHTLSVFHIEQMQPSWLSAKQRQSYYRMLNLIHLPFTILFYGVPALLAAPLLGIPSLFFGLGLALTGIMVVSSYHNDLTKNWYGHLPYSIAYSLAWGLSFIMSYGVAKGIIIGIYGFLGVFFAGLEGARFYAKRNANRDNIVVVELLHFSWKYIDLRSGIGGLVIGGIGALIYWYVFGTSISPLQLALGISAGGIVYGLFFVLYSGLTSGEVELHSLPNQGMRATFATAIRGGLFSGLTIILIALVGYAPVTSVAFGLGIGSVIGAIVSYTYWFGYGGFPLIQHLTLRLVLHRNKFIPQNYARFLDYAASLILMRKVGGGYIFIHRYLLEYFAALYRGK
jgi:serine/threonine protein kinase